MTQITSLFPELFIEIEFESIRKNAAEEKQTQSPYFMLKSESFIRLSVKSITLKQFNNLFEVLILNFFVFEYEVHSDQTRGINGDSSLSLIGVKEEGFIGI